MSNYKYDAFISYRHLEPDSFVAENVHKLLESYTIPKNLRKTLGKKKIGRVFRDREELPITDSLNDQIIDALNQSEFLIVICSPRLEESKWCKREIETFVAKNGKGKVLLVLADGEPDTAFPKIIYDGSSEPLAAEARGNSNRERLRKLKVEKLRILAQMLNVGFDDLKQRQKERRIKTILTAVSSAAVIAIAFAVLAVTSAVKISKQAENLAYDKALQMADESQRLLQDDKRLEALAVAYDALTVADDTKMPYTPEARYALVDALRIYDSAGYSKSVLEIDTSDTVCAMEFNSNPFEVIYADASGNVAVWLYKEYRKVFETFDGIRNSQSEHIVGYIDADRFYYINNNGEVVLASIKNQSEDMKVLNDAHFNSVYINAACDKLVAEADKTLYVYDLNDYSVIYKDSIEDTADDATKYADCIGWDDANGYILYSVCKEDASDIETLEVADIASGDCIFEADFANAKMCDCTCHDGEFYVLSTCAEGDLNKSYVCALNVKEKEAKWNSLFNGAAGQLWYTMGDTLAVTAGNDLYLYDCGNGTLLGNYSFNDGVGCLTEYDNVLYVRNLNGECSALDVRTGAYTYLGKMIECTRLNALKALEITPYNYAYMGIAANGNDNHLIFYNYMDNAYATVYDGELLTPAQETYLGNDAYNMAKDWGVDVRNTIYSIVTDGEDVAVISYKNGITTVYDMHSSKEIYSRNINSVIDRYLGTDIYGNKYFGNDNRTVMVSPDKEIIAAIDDMLGLTSDATGIVMDSYDEQRHPVQLRYNIYDKDELLEDAVSRMSHYHYR